MTIGMSFETKIEAGSAENSNNVRRKFSKVSSVVILYGKLRR